jgi:8-oxo-dGTP diphosphatase
MLTVVAALIEHEGKLLVCQRRKNGTFALQWEFPGGKVREGESLVSALERELREELGVAAQIGVEVYRTRHRYREMTSEIELIFFTARADAKAIRNLVFEQMLWAELPALPDMNFLPADRELTLKLASGEIRLMR